MEKKILSIYLLFSFFLLSSWSGFGQCPTSVGVTANPGTTICAGEAITFTANPTGGSAYEYQWQINQNDVSGQTSSTFTTSSLTNGQKVRVIVTSTADGNTGCSTTSSEVPVTVNPVRTVTATISANNSNICPGQTVNFTISSQNNIGSGSQYEWRVNGTSQGTSNTFSINNLVAGDQVQLWVDSSVPCTEPVLSNTITITEKPGTPDVPVAITGETTVCPGKPQTYSISPITNATEFIWTLPSGWTGSSTSTSISVTTGNAGTGTITVKAKNNCGTSAVQTLDITVSPGTPVTPGAISGKASVCPGATETYSVSQVANASEYIWTLPAGWNGTSNTNSISATTGIPGSGIITVEAKNSCGTSAKKSFNVTVQAGTPAQPETITGETAVCPGISKTYSVANVSNATSYTWQLPSGWSGTSTLNTITVNSGTTGGTISVSATNGCGTSSLQTLVVTIKDATPAAPVISGNITVCPGTTEGYSATSAGATEYFWTLPNGWTGTSTTGNISAVIGNTGAKTISVKAKNDCGTSAATTLNVTVTNPAPVISGSITGSTSVCSTATSLVYSIPAITNATSYAWSLPSGWTITSGGTTNSVTVKPSATAGTISVLAKNSCGDSSSLTLNVTTTTGVPTTPGTITTNLTSGICPPAAGITFTVPVVTGATGYEWSLPAGWEISSGANTRSITVNVTANAPYQNETVSVRARNECGLGNPTSYTDITVSNFILTDLGEDKLTCRARSQLSIDVELYFGGSKKLKPVWSTNGDGTFQNLPNIGNGNSNNNIPRFFPILYTPGPNDITKDFITISMTVPAPSGACGPGQDDMVIYFRDAPTATITAGTTICAGNSTDLNITGTANTTVTYKKGSGANQTISLGSGGSATINSGALNVSTTFQLISSFYNDTPTCQTTLSGSSTITVTPVPNASISYANAPFCSSDNATKNVTRTGTGGGTYTASPSGLTINSSGDITPGSSSPGTYTITYTIPASGGCDAVTATSEVIITALPTASISYGNSPFCSSDSSDKIVTLSGTNAYTGGTYTSGSGLTINASTGVIKAASSQPGTYTVIYTISAAAGCDPVITETEVTITELPAPVISYDQAEICKENIKTFSPTITGVGVVTGGTFSAPAGLNITPAGVINPSQSTPSTYKITYTLPAADGCGQIIAETEVTITPVPSVDISYDGPYCESTSGTKQVVFTNGTGAFENGSFNSSPSGLEINTSSGAIIPSASEPGEYTVTYNIPASGGCGVKTAETTVSITPVPKATINYNDAPFCTADASSYQVTFTNTTGSYENGTFSGTTGLNIIPNTGEITPAGSTAGTHTVTYTIPTGEGCDAVTTAVDIIIFQEVSINSQPFNIGTCTGEGVEFEVSAAGEGLSYQWYNGTFPGSPISGATSNIYNINSVTSQDDGIYYVEVSGTAPCEPVLSDEVTLNVDENIIVAVSPQDENICLNGDVTLFAEASANGGNVTYQWRLNENDLTGENNPSLILTNVQSSQAGEYSVFIEGPDGFTCSSIETSAATLTVYAPPVVETGQDFEVCSTETSIAIGEGATASNQTSLIWTTTGAGTISNSTNLTGATYAPVTADFGQNIEFTLTAILEVDGVQICTDAVDTKEISIIPQPKLPAFSYTANLTDTTTEFCETDTQVKGPTIDGNNLSNGTGTFTVDKPELTLDPQSGEFIPNGTDPGVYIITYTFNATSNTAVCTEVSRDFTVTIGANPIATFSYDSEIFCRDTRDAAFNTGPVISFDEAGHENVDSFIADNSGLVLDAATGAIDLSGSSAGTYTITRTVDYTGEGEDGCQPVSADFTITINDRPIPDFSYASTEYCSNPEIEEIITPVMGTNAVKGAFSYTATPANAVLALNTVNGEINITASEEGTFIIKNTLDTEGDGCDAVIAEFTISLDKLPVAFFTYAGISADNSFCISTVGATIDTTPDTGGTYTISGPGTLVKVDSSTGQLTWGVADGVAGSYVVTYKVPAGTVCDEVSYSETITIDALPVGGVLNFTGVGRVFTTCENAVDGFAAPLVLTGETGQVIEWQYKTATSSTWSIYNNQNTQLSSDEVEDLVNNTSTVIRAKIANGACNTNTYSATAIVSVIPSDIKPSPVEAEPTIVCFGTDISLSSKTGYGESFGQIEGGDFTSAGIKQEWRFTNLSGGPNDYSAAANNGRADHWLKMNASGGEKGKVYTGDLPTADSGGTIRWTTLYGVNEKFALVTGDNGSYMETPVFSLGSLDEAILTFDQAYNLTTGATISVEISTDGGNSYTKVLFTITSDGSMNIGSSGNYEDFGGGTVSTRPKNKMVLDLGDYLGQTNLRVRFNYNGSRDGDVWAVDNIKVPEGPQGVLLQWFYDDDPSDTDNSLEQIGVDNEEKVTFKPRKIGWNDFEVKTALLLDSNGNACESLDNIEKIRVFVFDTYETTVAVIPAGCGSYSATLNASISGALQGPLEATDVTFDGYKGEWKIEGPDGENYTLTKQNENSGLALINDPNVIFESENDADFTITWELKPTAVYPDDYSVVELRGLPIQNPACPPVSVPITPVFTDCSTLDFDGDDDVAVIDNSFSGAKAFEAWIRPEKAGGTIISGPTFEINTPTTGLTYNGRWYHVAVIFDGNDNGLYIDGIRIKDAPTGNGGGTRTSIGAKWTSADTEATNHFSGWIEEVRIWKNSPTLKEIRFMMNQRLKLNGTVSGSKVVNPLEGEIVPNRTVPGSYYTENGNNLDEDGDPFYDQTANDLFAYYRLISKDPDPVLGIITNTFKPVNGNTPDLSLSGIPGRLYNMTTDQENTSPTPYFSGNDGLWVTDDTWARPAVWDPPHTGSIEWNIVKTSHNITSGQREIKVLGLVSEINTLEMIGSNPAGWVGGGSGYPLFISHYLKLDGVIDLTGESQLLQSQGSIVDGSSSGSLQRDQQGTANSYNYNYWSSPVSPGASNSSYTVGGVLKDGTIPTNPGPISFGDPYAFADGNYAGGKRISNYWISTFFNFTADDYNSWNFQYGSGGVIKVGEGFTMKGTSGNVVLSTAQNYTFEGLPNNGTIELWSEINRNYLIGNPYPSAIDAHKFIDDNLVENRGGNYFDGALYFWDHFGKEDSHILLEYVGGYASLTKIGGAPAISNDDRVNNADLKENNKLPGRFIPVGQAFFINSTIGPGYTISPGNIQFKNSQRFFEIEGSNSQFLKPEEHVKAQKEPEIEKIRISFKSPLGYNRQILVGAHPSATNGFDLGYDAPLFDYNLEDMYWIQDDNWLVIQGVSNFDKDQVLPLGVVIEEEGEFTIKIDTLENIADGKLIYIKDILKDTIHNLTEAPFVATSEAGYINDRFEIIFYKEAPAITPEKPGDPTGPVPGEIPDGIELDVHHAHESRELQVLNPQQVDITNLYVYDLNGKLVETYYNIKNDKVVLLPVRNFSSGVYIVKLHSEDKVVSKKIIISN